MRFFLLILEKKYRNIVSLFQIKDQLTRDWESIGHGFLLCMLDPVDLCCSSLYNQLIGHTVKIRRRTEKTTTVTKKTKIPKRRMRNGDP